MSSFIYFAYGSNMLTARLRERCPSATPLGIAKAPGYAIRFHKEGLDGSGKATLARHTNGAASAQGVLFRVALCQRPALDAAEARYDRDDAFTVYDAATGQPVMASTYFAQQDACRAGLLPFDWYVAMIVTGAQQHGLDAEYIAALAALKLAIDPEPLRAARMGELLLTKISQ
jgi:hypothetical protein